MCGASIGRNTRARRPFRAVLIARLAVGTRERLDEIEHFFVSRDEREARRYERLGRKGPAAAQRLARRASIR
jgi:hypothetical protein